jgi:hypothetical protein
MFLFGVYQSWLSIPEIEQLISGQLADIITLDSKTLLEIIIVGYGLMAVASAWVVFKIGAGKHWARSSLMWGFALEVAWTACPPYHGVMDFLTGAPDIIMQGYALYLLYTKPGCEWFQQPVTTGTARKI